MGLFFCEALTVHCELVSFLWAKHRISTKASEAVENDFDVYAVPTPEKEGAHAFTPFFSGSKSP
jgi:hypothetical protein